MNGVGNCGLGFGGVGGFGVVGGGVGLGVGLRGSVCVLGGVFCGIGIGVLGMFGGILFGCFVIGRFGVGGGLFGFGGDVVIFSGVGKLGLLNGF